MTQPIDIRTRRVIGHEVRDYAAPSFYRSDNLRAHPVDLEDELERSWRHYRGEARKVRLQHGVLLFIYCTLVLIGCIAAFNLGRSM